MWMEDPAVVARKVRALTRAETDPLWMQVALAGKELSTAEADLITSPPAGIGVVVDTTELCTRRWLTYLHLSVRRGGVLLLGMNPGPNGMVQTGIPFTDPGIAQTLLNIPAARVRKAGPRLPEHIVDGPTLDLITSATTPSASRQWGTNPRTGKPLLTYTQSLLAPRQEPSARRLRRLLANMLGYRFTWEQATTLGVVMPDGSTATFENEGMWGLRAALWAVAQRVCMINLCPLVFIGEDGKNRNSAEIDHAVRRTVIEPAAERWLESVLKITAPRCVVQMGDWVTRVSNRVVKRCGYIGRVEKVRHPSPLGSPVEEDWRTAAGPVFAALLREVG